MRHGLSGWWPLVLGPMVLGPVAAAGPAALPAIDVDLGLLEVSRVTASLTISLCASSFDTEMAVWDEAGELLAQNDDTILCGGLQSLIELDFRGADAFFDPRFNGLRLVIGVTGWDMVFGDGFAAEPIGLTDAGTVQGTIGNAGFTLAVGPGEVAYVSFVVSSPCESCNPADLSELCGTLDINDIIQFATLFNQGAALADLSPAFGTFDINDVIEFANAFNAGCP